MHFIDYFPHRESGVTCYFQGERETDVTAKEELFGKAIYLLEKSLHQEPSSRAKFYLNQARRSLWQVTRKDTIAPTIRVKKPIYTNQRTVRFDITVTDLDSHVGDIRIGTSVGDVQIDRPRLFVELAKKEITETAELTIGPQEKYAVVTITASDVVGNQSKPNSALIIVDTQAPTASVAIVGDKPQQDGQVEVSIEAMDDFGLKQIQVGDDPNHKVDCDGAMKYSGTIRGIPRDGELVIMIVDRAENVTVSSVRLGRTSMAARQRRLDQPLPRYMPLVLEQETVRGQEPIVPFRYLDGPRAYSAWDASAVRLLIHSQVSLNPMPIQPMPVGSSIRQSLDFHFPPHVRSLGGIKETSQDFFYVDGTLYGARNVTRITVDGKKVPKLIRGATRVFSHKVNLTDIKLHETKLIEVKAFCRGDPDRPCAEKTIEVKKTADCSLRPDAIYGIIILPFTFHSSVACKSVGDDLVLRQAHAKAVKALRDLPPGKQKKRFRVYDVNEVIGTMRARGEVRNPGETSLSFDMGSILKHLRKLNSERLDDANRIDLVICGELIRNCPNDEERVEVEIKLKAIDVSSNAYIRFPGSYGDDTTRVLADVYGTIEDLQWYIELLAYKVAERIPRLEARVMDTRCGWRQSATIDRGLRHGLFDRMKFWVYEGNSKDRNGGVRNMICPAEVQKVGWFTSVVKLLTNDENCERIEDKDVAITK
jgi:hypothetical protein